MDLTQQLKRTKSIYQQIADKYETSYMYVYSIAKGWRIPTRGKAFEIRKELESLAEQRTAKK